MEFLCKNHQCAVFFSAAFVVGGFVALYLNCYYKQFQQQQPQKNKQARTEKKFRSFCVWFYRCLPVYFECAVCELSLCCLGFHTLLTSRFFRSFSLNLPFSECFFWLSFTAQWMVNSIDWTSAHRILHIFYFISQFPMKIYDVRKWSMAIGSKIYISFEQKCTKKFGKCK